MTTQPTSRFSQLPRSLVQQSRIVRFGDVPALLSHPEPDWRLPAPAVIWLHGRTANKELDPGRYLRWLRAGIAACAIDLPGHGERAVPDLQTPARTLEVIEQAAREIDSIVEGLADPQWNGAFDTSRVAIGGMSLGGMVTLRRLCDEHRFLAAAVEGTSGDLGALYAGTQQSSSDRLAALDPIRHLAGWRPIPLLALHSEADQKVPVSAMRGFISALQTHYQARGADPNLVQMTTWPETGAPEEHIGFGRYSNDAKNLQTEFLKRVLLAG